MNLYYSPGSCSLAPHIVLEELNVPYETLLISTTDGSTRSAEHLKINPKGRIPVLDVDGEIITEAAAIMIYLALQYSDSDILPSNPIGIARTIEWMNWLSGIHASIIAQSWRTERFTDEVSAYAAIKDKGMLNLQATYHQIDIKLAHKKWAVADKYSIADPYLLVLFRWGNRLGLDMRRYKNWTLHAARMEQRPAVQAVLRKEEISIWQ
ncbi:MAG: glutathione S-transferase N-terminal domain-containing protein [Oceanospirillaceae bacterium]